MQTMAVVEPSHRIDRVHCSLQILLSLSVQILRCSITLLETLPLHHRLASTFHILPPALMVVAGSWLLPVTAAVTSMTTWVVSISGLAETPEPILERTCGQHTVRTCGLFTMQSRGGLLVLRTVRTTVALGLVSRWSELRLSMALRLFQHR